MTEYTPTEAPRRNPLAEEAALWFARMRGPEADTYRTEFEAWLARGALHRGAYNRAAEIFSMGKFLEGDVTPGSDEQPKSESAPEENHRNPRMLPLVFLAICALLFVGWAVFAAPKLSGTHLDGIVAGEAATNGEIRFATKNGETRVEQLADGSTVVLEPDSLLIVAFDPKRRTLSLDRGAARFTVAHEPRPFFVHAGGGSVVARGTVFEVRITADKRVTVKLIEGKVDVTMPTTSKGQSVARLRPGQAIAFARQEQVLPPKPVSSASPMAMATATVTVTDMREYDQARLEDILAEANRASPVQILLSDPALGDRTVSGRFRLSDTAKLAEKLAWILNLRVVRHGSSGIILSPP